MLRVIPKLLNSLKPSPKTPKTNLSQKGHQAHSNKALIFIVGVQKQILIPALSAIKSSTSNCSHFRRAEDGSN